MEKYLRDGGIGKRIVHDEFLFAAPLKVPSYRRCFFNGKVPNRSVNTDVTVASGATVQTASISGEKQDLLR